MDYRMMYMDERIIYILEDDVYGFARCCPMPMEFIKIDFNKSNFLNQFYPRGTPGFPQIMSAHSIQPFTQL